MPIGRTADHPARQFSTTVSTLRLRVKTLHKGRRACKRGPVSIRPSGPQSRMSSQRSAGSGVLDARVGQFDRVQAKDLGRRDAELNWQAPPIEQLGMCQGSGSAQM
jgi:hypothetical protein